MRDSTESLESDSAIVAHEEAILLVSFNFWIFVFFLNFFEWTELDERTANNCRPSSKAD